jgi:hypothetical protein
MASGLRAGGLPVNVIVPEIVDWATATPGQPKTAASPTASHNLFPVRMRQSMVIVNVSFVELRKSYTRLAMRGNPPSRA